VLPAPQEAAASPHADRVEPRVITSPEHCDQSVTCRSSLGQIGNELSTGAMLSVSPNYFVLSTKDLPAEPPDKRSGGLQIPDQALTRHDGTGQVHGRIRVLAFHKEFHEHSRIGHRNCIGRLSFEPLRETDVSLSARTEMVWGHVIDQTQFRQRQPKPTLAATED
jgi:hypothetical protein